MSHGNARKVLDAWRSAPEAPGAQESLEALILAVIHEMYERFSELSPPPPCGYSKTDLHAAVRKSKAGFAGTFSICLRGMGVDAMRSDGSFRGRLAVTHEYRATASSKRQRDRMTRLVEATPSGWDPGGPVHNGETLVWSRALTELSADSLAEGSAAAAVWKGLSQAILLLDDQLTAVASGLHLRSTNVRDVLSRHVKPVRYLEPHPKRADTMVTATHFGANPYAETGQGWPLCEICGKGLDFIGQINTANTHDLSSALPLYVLYFCGNCPLWGDTGSWLCRSYERPDKGRAVRLTDPRDSETTTQDCEVTILHRKSLPCANDAPLFGVDIESIEASGTSYSELAQGLVGEPPSETFIGGYPLSAIGAGFPRCRECDQRMVLLTQIGSHPDSYFWGDHGTAYLFLCPQHPRRTGLIVQWTGPDSQQPYPPS